MTHQFDLSELLGKTLAQMGAPSGAPVKTLTMNVMPPASAGVPPAGARVPPEVGAVPPAVPQLPKPPSADAAEVGAKAVEHAGAKTGPGRGHTRVPARVRPKHNHHKNAGKGGTRLCMSEQEVVQLARRRSVRALDVVSAIYEERRNPPSVRLRAAQEMLARAWGPTKDTVATEGGLTPDEMHFAAQKLQAMITKCRVGRRALPTWAQIASDLLTSGDTAGALQVALTENPALPLVRSTGAPDGQVAPAGGSNAGTEDSAGGTMGKSVPGR